jgi:hypothetical protein
MQKTLSLLLAAFVAYTLHAQPDRWQQHIKYNIDVDLDVVTNQFTGKEKIEYTNNSPDTLNRIFIHLYWNAFQPGSMMDVRSRELGKIQIMTNRKGEPVYDWDSRVTDRISKLQPNEIGYDSVNYVKINGTSQKLIYHETILEVDLDKPILPHTKTPMDISFKCQVPLQVRRSGRDNAQGVRYSMSQWYPKVVEYDYQGWNANPYIAREFYGVWGDYDVNITLDKTYLVASSGTLQNANEIGFGYEATGVKVPAHTGNTLTWKFSGQNIHDFVWAADPQYLLIKKQIANGPLLYFVYKNNPDQNKAWENLADTMPIAYQFMSKTFGAYPYKNYTFIQGGDGGMEYPMATLIKNASKGTAIHEWMHSWYQGMMGTNESLYPWMDEGFTSYAEERTTAWLMKDSGFTFENSYAGYNYLAKSGKEEPMSTHSDHYNTNFAYSQAAYSKGAVFMAQLGYIVGNKVLDKILLEYYKEWRFKHPNPNDFIRVAEKVSGLELQWYKEYWVYTTKTIDYAIGDINADANGHASITLKRLGLMPMPVDVLVTYKNGSKEMHTIPVNMMYGSKQAEDNTPFFAEQEWKWVNPQYQLLLQHSVADIKQIEIDPSLRMADINRQNNTLTIPGN